MKTIDQHKTSEDILAQDSRRIMDTECMQILKKYTKPLQISLHEMIGKESAKRIIAPHVQMVRRGKRSTLRRRSSTFEYFSSRKGDFVKRVSRASQKEYPELINETADLLKLLTDSLGVRLYLVDIGTNELFEYQKYVNYSRCRVNYDLENDNYLPVWVAKHREFIVTEDITQDNRFKNNVTYKDNVKSVLCVPIMKVYECYGVLELYRHHSSIPYKHKEVKLVLLVVGWIGAALQQNESGHIIHRKHQINEELMDVVLGYYGNLFSFEDALGEIINYTKKNLKAEKGAFYVIKNDGDAAKYADVYEEGITDENKYLIKKKLCVKLTMDSGIVSTAALTKELVNIPDLHSDPRFSKTIYKDNDLMVVQRSILCMPVINEGKVLGVVTVINKIDGLSFTNHDEEYIKVIATYCSLLLTHYNNKIENDNLKLQLAESNNFTSIHLKPCEHAMIEMNEPYTLPKNIRDFSWYISPEDINLMPRLFIYMIKEIIPKKYINMDQLTKFTLTVMRSYRKCPYHNFEHAFNAAHCMYTILLRNVDRFPLLDREALMIATISHDADHEGYTSNFLLVTEHLYSRLYGDYACLEYHHSYVVKRILEVYPNIFTNLNEASYPQFVKLVHKLILDTNLINYFKSRAKLIPLVKSGMVDFNNTLHVELIESIMMTACDLSGQCKLFSTTKRLIDCLYEEFYNQGELEKSMGIIPLPMMDKNFQNLVPEDQVQFLTIVVIVCMDILSKVLNNVEDLHTICQLIRDTWLRIIESRGDKLWRQYDSLV